MVVTTYNFSSLFQPSKRKFEVAKETKKDIHEVLSMIARKCGRVTFDKNHYILKHFYLQYLLSNFLCVEEHLKHFIKYLNRVQNNFYPGIEGIFSKDFRGYDVQRKKIP